MRARTAVLGTVLGSALVIGLCGGCASNTAPVEVATRQSPTAAVIKTAATGEPSCPSDSADPAIARLAALGPDGAASTSNPPLPADFDAVAVVRCEVELETIAGDGTWNVALAQRATGDLSALTSALRTPSSSAPTGSGYACASVGEAVPDFALVDAQGRIVLPGMPHDACGELLTPVFDALNALPWKTETEQRLSQVQTQAEIDTGCPPAYKNVFDLPVPSATPWTTSLEPTTACEYTVSPKLSAGGSVGVGEFDHAVKLSAAQQLAITTALKSSGSTAAKACSAQASTFALLTVSASENIVVELDGCLRVSYPDYFVTQAPPSLLATLRAAGL
jgi:hypothetical protein